MKLRIKKITNKNGSLIYRVESKEPYQPEEIITLVFIIVFFPLFLLMLFTVPATLINMFNTWEEKEEFNWQSDAEEFCEKIIKEESQKILKLKEEEKIIQGKEKMKSETIKNYAIK